MENTKLKELLLKWQPPSNAAVVLSSYVIINNINRECVAICFDYDSAKHMFSIMSHKDPVKNSIFMLFRVEISTTQQVFSVFQDDKFQKAEDFYYEMYFDMICNKIFKKQDDIVKEIGDFAASFGKYKRNKNE